MMNGKIKAGIALVVVGALVGLALVAHKTRSGPAVTVTLRIAVSPGEQVDFVSGGGGEFRPVQVSGRQAVRRKAGAGPEANVQIGAAFLARGSTGRRAHKG